MKDLVQELLQPSVNEEGTVLPVSNVKRRAAQAIVHLTNLQQNDLAARLALQAEVAELTTHIVAFSGPPIEYCVDEYRIVSNLEYERDFK